jgi:hypothetical protein
VKESINCDVEFVIMIEGVNEGEMKIRYQLEYISCKNKEDTHIVFSTDSDMILLLTSCTYLDKIYQAMKKDSILSIGELHKKHCEKYGKTSTSKNDFIFLSLLMGNDYLPKLQYLTLENLWDAYKFYSPYYQKGLVQYDTKEKIVKTNNIFMYDIINYASKKVKNNFANQCDENDFNKSFYKEYIQGLFWCFGMYVTGMCTDYKFLYNSTEKPHYLGLMFAFIVSENTYKITKSPPIHNDLYGILLIPEKANILLTKEQRMIADKLVIEHPIIYEEERCELCNEYYKTIMNDKKQHRSLPVNGENRGTLQDKIKDDNKKMNAHKKKHGALTYDIIMNINQTFNKIKNDIEVLSESETDESDDEKKKYIPNSQKKKIASKRLF